MEAVDACGNQSGTVAQTITVIDNTPPVIGGQEAIQQYSVRPHHPLLHPPHRMYVVQQVCNSSVM
jgi:hypothetical protein